MKRKINFIAFLGPDGSGKSTIIKKLKKEEELPFRKIECFHLKPRLFGDKGDGKPVKEPHSKCPHKGYKSYLKLFYFALDYILGYWIKVFPLKVKSSLIVFDRYYDDIYIDPKRCRYGGNLKIAKLLKYFIPKPNFYIVLTAKPEVIYSRKKEVEFEELKRQINKYNKLIDNKKYFGIDVDKEPEKIVEDVKNILFSFLVKRYSR